MAFTLQDGTGTVANANSYIDEVFFNIYHGDRGVAAIANSTYTTDEIREAAVVATDYIDTRFRYVGDRQHDRTTQTTEWPRLDAIDRDQRLMNGIPLVVQQACAEYALFKLANGTLFIETTNPTTGQKTKRTFSKVSVIEEETEYYQGTIGVPPALPIYHQADQRLISAGIVVGPSQTLVRA
jgi:hypothetical protein